jgi:putative two-component system response regulator
MSEVRPKILIIDDEIVSSKALAMQLEADYEISLNHDGRNIAELIRQNRPDLILLDIMLPEVSGYDICEALRVSKETEDIPVIFLTGLEDSFNEQIGLDMGAVDYVIKPISPEILKTRILNVIQVNMYIEFLEKLLGEKDIALTTLQQEAELLLQCRQI